MPMPTWRSERAGEPDSLSGSLPFAGARRRFAGRGRGGIGKGGGMMNRCIKCRYVNENPFFRQGGNRVCGILQNRGISSESVDAVGAGGCGKLCG